RVREQLAVIAYGLGEALKGGITKKKRRGRLEEIGVEKKGCWEWVYENNEMERQREETTLRGWYGGDIEMRLERGLVRGKGVGEKVEFGVGSDGGMELGEGGGGGVGGVGKGFL
ncbi:hypothetical protein, partial [Neisseria sicca]|uniref:hypothetical protein n=1 Tax=Neisseria sicca TaxID=490 RepID=UPI001C99B548